MVYWRVEYPFDKRRATQSFQIGYLEALVAALQRPLQTNAFSRLRILCLP